jgi:hypothetical protein
LLKLYKEYLNECLILSIEYSSSNSFTNSTNRLDDIINRNKINSISSKNFKMGNVNGNGKVYGNGFDNSYSKKKMKKGFDKNLVDNSLIRQDYSDNEKSGKL